MRKLDEKIKKAIYSLKGNPDFEVFREWIQASYDDLVTVVIKDGATADHTHRVYQGMALTCRKIIEVIQEIKQ